MGELMLEDASAAAEFFEQRARELRRIGDEVVVGRGDERRGGIGLDRDLRPTATFGTYQK